MNMFIYLKLREINYKFLKSPTMILHRPYDNEIEWYMTC